MPGTAVKERPGRERPAAPARERMRASRPRRRIVVGTRKQADSAAFERFVERLRMDAFDVYASVRAAQRHAGGSPLERLTMLGAASKRARGIADEIDRRRAEPVIDFDADDHAFAVPI